MSSYWKKGESVAELTQEGTGGDILAQALINQGVTQIFGIPGVQLDGAVDALYKRSEELAFTCARNEQATTYMADGYARSTGAEGVAMVVPGPGMLNATAGLATAYAANSPVLLISGQINSTMIGKGYGALHEIPDQSGILARLTKWSGLATKPEEVPGLVEEAFRQLRSGRPRPVAIEVPMDVLHARATVGIADRVGFAPTPPDAEVLDRAAQLLASAHKPLIYVGGGVRAADASAALVELAESLEAPVIVSENGRGAIDARHRLAFDGLALRRFREDADVVLVVGSRLATAGGQPVNLGTGRVVMLNVEEADLRGPHPIDVAIHGDARLGLEALVSGIGTTQRESREAELSGIRAWCEEQFATIQPQLDYLAAIRSALPEDGVFVSELTQIGYVANIRFPAYHARGFIGPSYQGTLGFGFSTALGAKTANPDRAVVSVSGDGGFSWTLQELSTAKRFNIGLAAIVFNDGHFGNVRRIQRDSYGGRFFATDLTNPDYQKLAGAFGVASAKVETPKQLQGVLSEAFSGNEPLLIEVPVGDFPSPWPLIHER
jgi:Thiamine pyrophosphate-requiring enzymes [acetolactate synthase, pyruvate dehydrogenase (cytochrome), glyoxylate carboligase, phosphonopyruvate decarboxylase]